MLRAFCYRRTDEPERDLLLRAAAWPELDRLDDLDAATLRAVSRREGIDFATALLYDRLRRSAKLAPTISDAGPLADAGSLDGGSCGDRTPVDIDVVVVPGAFHAQRAETGADGRRVIEAARRLGGSATVVDVPSFGSPASNAKAILRTLAARRSDRRLVLVSLSKGSLDVRCALESVGTDDIWRKVDCWISLSGIATGSPLVGWLRRRPWRLVGVRLFFAWHALPYRVLREIDRDTIGERRQGLSESSARQLQTVHVVGFPLRRHLSCPLARRGHRRLAPLGPNDGGVLLADVCQLPGVVYPVWGADHYLKLADADVGTIFARVLANKMAADSKALVTSVWRETV